MRLMNGRILQGSQLEVSKRKFAQVLSPIDPEAKDKLVNHRYVNDCSTSGSKDSVKRML